MTLNNEECLVAYRGDGSATVWDFDFIIPEAANLFVSLQNYETGDIVDELVNGADYSATGFGNPLGGSVTYPLSGNPLSASYRIIIQRIMPYTQDLDIQNQGGFFPDTNEQQLDEIVMQIQQIAELQSRSVTVNPGQTVPNANQIADAEQFAERAEAAAASARQFENPQAYGAIGDGNSHPLSQFFASLALAQVVYPFATSLTEEIDWAAFQKAANQGNTRLWLDRWRSYRFNRQLLVTSNGFAIDGDKTCTILADMTFFTNTTLAGELGSTGCIIYAHGNTSIPYVSLEKFSVQNVRILPLGYDGTQGSIIAARRTTVIAARNIKNLFIVGCEIAGFCVGTAITVDSCIRDVEVSDNNIHDWYSNDVWPDNPTSQTTGVCLDQNRINGVGTVGFKIDGNTIGNLEKGSTTYTAWGVQTDAINLNGGNGGYGSVSNNVIYNVDEGVDCFMQGVVISNNSIKLTQGTSIKIIHGASKNSIIGNNCLDARGWGMAIVGTSAGAVLNNHIVGNYFEATGGTLNPALGDTACLYIGEITNACNRNYFSGNTWFANGCEWVCKNDDYLGTGNENYSTGDEWRGPGTGGWFNATNLLLICQKPVDPTRIKAGLTAVLDRNTSGEIAVVWTAETLDKRGEFNTTTGQFTAQLPGYYDVSLKMYTVNLTAASDRAILRLKNLPGTTLAMGIAETDSTMSAHPALVEFGIALGSGQGLKTSLEIESSPGTTVNFNNDATQTSFEIKAS